MKQIFSVLLINQSTRRTLHFYIPKVLSILSTVKDFQVSVDDEKELLKETVIISSKRRRANVTGEPASNKKQVEICPACEKKGHDLKSCWCRFPDLAPKHIVLSKQVTDRALRNIEGSNKLCKQMDKIKRNMEKKKKNEGLTA